MSGRMSRGDDSEEENGSDYQRFKRFLDMTDEEVTKSLLEEYSIAEVHGVNGDESEIIVEEIHRESLRDAFSRYAKVIFHDISDSYPTDADVQCFFSLTLDMKHKDGDVVGLFRLGWRSPSEMIISQAVPKPTSEDQRDFQVQFRASDLPKDEGEIYQLCYISENEVWGASVPFEFRRATAEELLVVDSGDLVIVRSQSAVVEDLKCQLATLRSELTTAEANNVKVEKELAKLQEENTILKKRLEDLEKIEQVLDRLRADNQALDEARNVSESALRESELQIESLNSMVKSLQKDMDILQKQVATQSEELLKREDVAVSSATQRGFSQDLVDALREGKELAVREMRAALSENEKLQKELDTAAGEKRCFLHNIENLSQRYSALLNEQETNESSLKKRIEELLVKLTQLTSDSQQHLSEAKAETEVLRKKVTFLEVELQNKNQALQILNAEMASSFFMCQKESQKQEQVIEPVADLTTLQNHLKSIQTLRKEVYGDIRKVEEEKNSLQETEDKVIKCHDLLARWITTIKKIIIDHKSSENVYEVGIYKIELKNAEEKFEKKKIYMESIYHRRDELDKQLKELGKECIVLEQQESEAAAAITTIAKNVSSVADKCGITDLAAIEEDTETALNLTSQHVTKAWAEQEVSAVAELQERLRLAAEAYKTLYQEKLIVERQLARLQDMKPSCDEESV